MNQYLNELWQLGERVYDFLIRLHNKSNPSHLRLFLRSDDDESSYRKDIYNLREYLTEALRYRVVQKILEGYDIVTQARIKNIVAAYKDFHRADMIGADMPHNIARKEREYNKLLADISKLDPDEQVILWEHRVWQYLKEEASTKLIAEFIFDIKRELKTNSPVEKVNFIQETWEILIKWVPFWKKLKPKFRTYKLFKILFENIDQRVDCDAIKSAITKSVISKTNSDYVSDVLLYLPKEIRKFIKPSGKWYILDTNEI